MNAPQEIVGSVYNLQRYNLHDGDGIRSILFLKGCPLRCLWCSNPESQRFEAEQMGDRIVGYSMSVAAAIARLNRDKPFFDYSGGGITLSGGEPLSQPEFTLALIKAAKQAGLHVALESSAYADPQVFAEIAQCCDLLLLDLKHMSEVEHQRLTGVSNKRILANIQQAAAWSREKTKEQGTGLRVIARVPVVPGHNDSMDNLEQTVVFCSEHGLKEVHLLAYHRLGMSKYQQLERSYALSEVQVPNKEDLKTLAIALGNKHGITIKVL